MAITAVLGFCLFVLVTRIRDAETIKAHLTVTQCYERLSLRPDLINCVLTLYFLSADTLEHALTILP